MTICIRKKDLTGNWDMEEVLSTWAYCPEFACKTGPPSLSSPTKLALRPCLLLAASLPVGEGLGLLSEALELVEGDLLGRRSAYVDAAETFRYHGDHLRVEGTGSSHVV